MQIEKDAIEAKTDTLKKQSQSLMQDILAMEENLKATRAALSRVQGAIDAYSDILNNLN
jgi:hypothetical protein